jgi:AraC-like DNA-binding protein
MSITSSIGILATCPWLPSFRSDDLGEVQRFFRDFDGSRARVAHGSQPMGCASYHLKGRYTRLGSTASVVGQTARWVVDGPVFQLHVPVGSVYRTGRQVSVATGPSSVVVLPPAWEWTRISPPGIVLAAQVQSSALRKELRALRPASGGELVRRLVVRDIDPDNKARLFAAVADVAQATRPGADPHQLVLAEARLLTQLTQLIPQGPVRRRPADMTEQRVRDLEGWIEAHLGEPITLGELCQVAGVGARCLQRTFEYRRGVSPMRFVAERRLAATHHALLHAGSQANVTSIALAHGFDHVGRFAQLYRQVIGELPSRTLARQRQP